MTPVTKTGKAPARFVFITGLSGSGKTLAMKALEDAGFFCVDNLPPKLLGPFAELTAKGGESIERVAVVVDIRERGFLKDFPEVFGRLRKRGFETTLIFLEARDEVVVRRFSESRRPHPLAVGKGSVLEAVRKERRKLSAIRRLADQILDTSEMTVHELRRYLLEQFQDVEGRRGPAMNVVSFGYKFGVPHDADLVFDVRFLPNPFFEKDLRAKDGNHPAVERFLLSFPATNEFIQRLESFVNYLIPQYTSEGKSYLTIAIGCTGGRHRSVMVAKEMAGRLKKQGLSVTVTHRDVEGGS
ncbi:MAG: RNase adapter RapZ [Vicinamibacteria bacterium]